MSLTPLPQIHMRQIINKAHITKLIFIGGFTLLGPLLGGMALIALSPQITPHLIPIMSGSGFNVSATALFIAVGAIIIGAALVPSIVFSAFIGYITKDYSTACSVTAITIGFATLLGIWLFRYFSGAAAEAILSYRKEWLAEFHRLQSHHKKGLLSIIFLARLSPHMPFAATNLMIAQLKIPFRQAVFVSWIGLLPRSLFAAIVGIEINTVMQLTDIKQYGWYNLASLILILVGVIYFGKKWLQKRTGLDSANH